MADKVFQREREFTKAYQRHINDHPAIREAACLKAQYPGALGPIEAGDLFAGRIRPAAVGFTPDEWGQTAFGYYHLPARFKEVLQRSDLSPEDRAEIEAMLEFWSKENTSTKVRARYTPEMLEVMPSDNWMNEPGMVFPLYRLCGAYPNYGKLVTLGLPGLRQEIRSAQENAERAGGDGELFAGMIAALDVLADSCQFYADEALRLADTAGAERARELRIMAEVLQAIKTEAPRTFREAIQLMWLYSIVADVRNYGRMDVYLGDFLAADLDGGRLTEAEALKLLQSLWQLMADRNTRVHGRVIIGGKGRPNEANADRFALLAMEATRTVLEIEPQLSLRFYEGMNPALMEKALEVIGEGRTYPILYNDDVNIPAVEHAFELPQEEAEQYVPFGCGEYIINHRSFGTPSGVINLLKCLEVTMRNGVDPTTGERVGLELGDLSSFATFDELFEAYKRQVEYLVDFMAMQEQMEYEVVGETMANLYLSMLYDDCIERGKGIFSGGIRYLGGTLETYGNTNTADSLTAIKKLVYEEKRISPEELLAALDANFEGYEHIREQLLAAPKYGNDDPEADSMAVAVHEHVCHTVRNQREKTDLHSYLVVIINNSANTLMGRWTAASPDGRKARVSMANGNNPTGGMDKKGITAMLNSLVKLDPAIHAGAVQNMKFSPELFTSNRDKLQALLKAYFDNGGAQAMITVVNRGDLEAAMREPEKYQHIFVRVGGFSARFVELDRDVQLEILSRTLY
ncbi:MAG: pyruvate formate lyase family protein [Limnochordia bacterium]|jgi:pyruvate-formate lyase